MADEDYYINDLANAGVPDPTRPMLPQLDDSVEPTMILPRRDDIPVETEGAPRAMPVPYDVFETDPQSMAAFEGSNIMADASTAMPVSDETEEPLVAPQEPVLIDTVPDEPLPEQEAPEFVGPPAEVVEQQRRSRQMDNILQIAIDPTSFQQENGIPERRVKGAVNTAFLKTLVNEEISGEPSDMSRQAAIRLVGQKMFPEQGVTDEDTLFAAIQGKATKRRDEMDLNNAIKQFAEKSATLGEAGGLAMQGEWDKVKAMPGFDPTKTADYIRMRTMYEQRAADAIRPYAPTIKQFIDEFDAGGSIEEIPPAEITAWSEDEWQGLLQAMSIYSQGMTEENRESWLKGMGKSFHRASKDIVYGSVRFGVGSAMKAEAMGKLVIKDLTGIGKDREDIVADEVKTVEDFEIFRDRLGDLQKIFSGEYDPVEKTGKWYVDWPQEIPAMAGNIALMANPFALVGAVGEGTRDSLYQNARAQGFSEVDARKYRDTIGPAVYVPVMLIEKLQVKTATGKIPGYNQLLVGISNRFSNKFLRGGARAVTTTAVEAGQEVAQDMTDTTVREVASWLGGEMASVEWTDEMIQNALNYPEYFVSMLAVGALGATGGRHLDEAAAALQSDLKTSKQARMQMIMAGANSADLDALEKAEGMGETNEAFQKIYENLDPQSEEAKEMLENIKKAQKFQERMAAAEAEVRDGRLPVFSLGENGYTVTDGSTGEVIGEGLTHEQALETAKEAFMAVQAFDDTMTAELASILLTQEKMGQEGGKAEISLASKSALEHAKEQGPEQEKRFWLQVERMKQSGELSEGADPALLPVFGANYLEDKGAGKGKQIVTKIFGGGRGLMTVFHEEAHGYLRTAIANNTMTWGGVYNFFRDLDKGLKNKFLGENFGEVVDGKLTQAQMVALDEAVAELMEVEIMRTRKRGGMKGNLEADKIREGLLASMKLRARGASYGEGEMGEKARAAKGFGKILFAARHFWKTIFSRLTQIRAGIASGEISEADIEKFTNTLFGLDEQAEFDKRVGQEAESLGPAPDVSGEALSLGAINKTSANALADKQGVPRTIPAKYEGKKVLPIMADLLGAGEADGVPLTGGPAHPLLHPGTGVAWRSNKGAIAGILGMLKSRGAVWKDADGKRKGLVSVFAMSQDAHQSNKNTFLSFIKAIENSNVSKAAKQRLGKYVREKSKLKSYQSERLAKFPLNWDTAKLDAYAADFSFADRAAFISMLRLAGAQDIGIPDAETIVRQLRDDSYDKVSSGSMLSIIEVDVDRLEKGLEEDTLSASDFGVDEHISYDTVLPGEIVTHLRQPVAMEVAFKDMVDQMAKVSPKSRPDYLMQAKLPRSVELETLTAERMAEINNEQAGQTSIAKAKAYIAALSGNWNTINTKSQQGVADFISAMKRNLFSETLTQMDRGEVTKMAKAGKMEVFGLEGFDVWFGLVKRDDGGKELVSVISNEHSTGGMLDLVMMKAIEEGATHLDCYAVRNNKMPDGLLPTLYAKHGWTATETLPYDKSYLGDTEAARNKKEKALMAQWEAQGWNKALHGMPDVVIMEHGTASSSTQESQADAQGGLAERAVVEAGSESAEPTSRDATDGEARTDRGEPARDAGRSGERYSRKVRDFASELAAASGNRLKAWGITPEQRDQILAENAAEDYASFSVGPAGTRAKFYYSKMEQVIGQKLQGKTATPEQIMAVIDPGKGSGVKAEEIKWSGIEAKVQALAEENDGKVPVAELREWINAEGMVKLEEVALGARSDRGVRQQQVVADLNAMGYSVDVGMDGEIQITAIEDGEAQEIEDLPAEAIPLVDELSNLPSFAEVAQDGVKYAEYTLPGGENYQEVVLTMPVNIKEYEARVRSMSEEELAIETMRVSGMEMERGLGREANINFILLHGGASVTGKLGEYTSSHFRGIPNYIAHMRTNEREDASGELGLFIEEIQSDRHQEGRKRGYKGDTPTDKEVRDFFGLSEDVDPDQYREEMMQHPDRKKAVADAPFRKDWHLAMFKRALGHAVDRGMNWIGWTTGETQNDRYDLSKQVDEITWNEQYEELNAWKKGEAVLTRKAEANELEGLIGKDAAKNLIEEKPAEDGFRRISGDQLKVGGEGMKGFYDKMLPAAVQKYVKKWGAEVQKADLNSDRDVYTELRIDTNDVNGKLYVFEGNGGDVAGPFETRKEAQKWIDAEVAKQTPIWKVEITDAMRKNIEQVGQPAFSLGQTVTPAMDAQYMAAVEAGDIEAAQELVDQAAKKAGYDSGPVWHGTTAEFNEFDPDTVGAKDSGFLGRGFYFSTNETTASWYGNMTSFPVRFFDRDFRDESPFFSRGKSRIGRFFLRGNMLTVPMKRFSGEATDKLYSMAEVLGLNPEVVTSSQITNEAVRQGYDGAQITFGDDASQMRGAQRQTETVVFNPNQIKSADPVTYDDAGNVIPLSERFNEQSQDIRYSLGPAAMAGSLADAARRRMMKSPEYQMVFFENLMKRLQAIQAFIETRGTAYNFDAFGKEFEGKFTDEKEGLLNALAMMEAIQKSLPPDLRGRLGGGALSLAKQDTDEKRLEYLKGRVKAATKVVEQWTNREMDKALDKLFKREKVKKNTAGKKPGGKAGATIHEVFATLREYKDKGQTDVDAKVTGIEAQLNGPGYDTSEDESKARMELNLVGLIGNWREATVSRKIQAIKEATIAFEAGYYTYQLQKLMEKEDRDIKREELRKQTGKAGHGSERDEQVQKDQGLLGKGKEVMLDLLSFEDLLGFIFGKESAIVKRWVDLERKASDFKEDFIQNRMDALDDLFTALRGGNRFKGEELRWKMASQKTIKVQGRQFTEFEALSATMMWMQEDGRRHMEGPKDDNGKPQAGKWNYDQAFVDEIEAKLSDEAKQVRAHLMQVYGKEYGQINPTFKKLNGINLPSNALYSPITVKPVQGTDVNIDPTTGFAMGQGSATPGSLRTRGMAIAEPDFRDVVQTYISHTKQIGHYLGYAPMLQEVSPILRNRDLSNSVEASAGVQARKVLQKWEQYFHQGGVVDAAAQLAVQNLLGRMVGRAAGAILIGRISVIMIQSTQLLASIAEMPVGSFLFRFSKLMTGNLGWGKAFKSDYIQRRLKEMPVSVREAMKGLEASKPNRLKYWVQKAGRSIAGMDALMTAGTYAIVYDYKLKEAGKNGLTGQEAESYATNAAERSVDRVAQPTRAGTRSIFENNVTNPIARVGWAFASEARQKLALGLYRAGSKQRTLGEKGRALAVTWLVGGAFATLLRTMWRDLKDDEDDEVFDSRNWDPTRLILASLTGPLQGVPFLGSAIETGIWRATGEYMPDGDMLSAIPDAMEAAMDIGEFAEQDIDATMKDVETMLSGGALLNDTFAAAASVSHLVRDLYRAIKANLPD